MNYLKRSSFLPVLFIIFISIWSVWLVIRDVKRNVTDRGDAVFLVWVINQSVNKIQGNLDEIFEGNIFHPYKNTMAYSDLMIPSAIISYIPVKILKEPTVAFGTTMLFGQIATILISYFWFHDLSKNRWSSLIGSIVLGLSQIRMHYTVHLQMWNMQWWLVSVWMIWRFAKDSKIKHLWIAGLFLTIQVWESLLPLVFAAAAGIIILLSNKVNLRPVWKQIALISIFFLIFSAPVFNAYASVSREFHYVRPIREVAHFSGSLDEVWGRFLSPGLYVLSFVSLLLLSKKEKKNYKWILLTVLAGFIMFLGPVLKYEGQTVKIFNIFIPIPYGIFYYLVPVFGAFRTPLRWLWVSAFGLSALIAVGFKNITNSKITILALLAIGILGGTRVGTVYAFPPISNYPKVYKWLKDQPGKVIVELPMSSWGVSGSEDEFARMVYSLYNKKTLVNGGSGFFPPEWLELAGRLAAGFPNDELKKELSQLEVDYIVVHKNKYGPQKIEEIEKWGSKLLIYEDDSELVYQI